MATSIGLILGGARSGKSRFAQDQALKLSPRPIYVATSRPWDDDHRARIARHQKDRGAQWRTVEEEKQISQAGKAGAVMVVDCVTLWLTNWFLDSGSNVDRALDEARNEFDRAAQLDATWLFVSNELGQGLHAPTEAGRKFTDLQGFMNQHIAARADWVVLTVAGIPVPIKGQTP